MKDGGAEGIRTPDPHNAIVVLYQLSYDPIQSRYLPKLKGDRIFVKGNGLWLQASGYFFSKEEKRPSRLLMGADCLGFRTFRR